MTNHYWPRILIVACCAWSLGFSSFAAETTADEPSADASRAAIIRQVDQRILEHLQQAGVTPAPRSDDAEFHRRVWLDLAGITPKVVDVRRFLADAQPDKRVRLVNQLLDSPSHATQIGRASCRERV